MKMQTLRPGYWVILNTTIASKNVKYNRVELEAEHITDEGTQRAKWEQTRVVLDPAEQKAGIQARGLARSAIIKPCSWNEFGYMVSEENLPKLREAEIEAKRIAEEFNRTAALTRVNVYVIAAKVASNDVEAMEKINGELREYFDDIQSAVKALDYEAIRENVTRLAKMEGMLSDDVRESTNAAIKAGRKIANDIAKAVREKAEVAAIKIDSELTTKIETARAMFLDLDAVAEVATPEISDLRAVALDPDVKAEPVANDYDDSIELPADTRPIIAAPVISPTLFDM